MNEILELAEQKQQKIVDFFAKDLSTISTGRANPSLLDKVSVSSYGSLSPLSQVANISVLDSSRISVQPWDKGLMKEIEKVIVDSNLGFAPIPDGERLVITIPKLSSQRRQELVKLAKKYSEDKKIAIRNSRRDSIESFKKTNPSEDQKYKFNSAIQKITDKYIAQIESLFKEKENDLTTV